MGLFFNYDKPGPGVDKDAPRRRGIFLYFELLWRNFGKMFLSNMLYFVMSLPVLALYFVLVSVAMANILPDASGSAVLSQTVVIITLLIVIFWGTGPLSCGYAYVLRNIAREEHTWVFSDFFQFTKESFLRGLLYLAIDVVMLLCTGVAVWVYWGLAQSTGGIFSVLLFISVLVAAFYTAMHFYIYQLEVTFKGSVLQVYKNAALMAFATMPMCILIGLVIYFATTYFMGFLAPLGVLTVAFLCWISFMRFGIDFYSARIIKRMILPKFEEPKEDDE